MPRRYLVLFHRYVGLVMAFFLLIAGLTGALLAWYHELEVALNPSLLQVQPPSGATALPPLVLRERVQALYPDANVNFVNLQMEADQSAHFYIEGPLDPVTKENAELPNDEIFLNPYTGEKLGERKWGDISQGWKNLMPFVYRLHYQLALDTVGAYLFGIVALLWTLDCFVAAWLTLPARKRATTGKKVKAGAQRNWWARWWPAWKVRWNGGSFKLNYDLHRAGGLWPWAMLFVFAWSSVAFNLTEVYNPVMKALFPMQAVVGPAEVAQEKPLPAMSWAQGLATGRALMTALAQAQGFAVEHEQNLYYDPHGGRFRYRVMSDRDIRNKYGTTEITFDATSGELVHFYLPTGAASGDTITSWLLTLHMAAIWGIPFKLFVCVLGIAVAILSGTGVYIWWRKRAGRLKLAAREPVRRNRRVATGSVVSPTDTAPDLHP